MYLHFDGFTISEPPFALLSLDELEECGEAVAFGICDRVHVLAFDTRSLNEAGQWFIISAGTGHRVTYTVGSLLSTHLWAWIERRRPFWQDIFG